MKELYSLSVDVRLAVYVRFVLKVLDPRRSSGTGFPSYGYVGGLEPRVSEDTRSRELVNQMLAACMHAWTCCLWPVPYSHIYICIHIHVQNILKYVNVCKTYVCNETNVCLDLYGCSVY